ncbi:hypothetical protein PVAND_013517 [Polypedilum vanderplanki]|uniref:Odorant receptor n=1 Tax=Polypedilum vanderplanki TaxID=319348 RepID=A0A9J6CPX8_POLVA|nr:hypothetical protein PVAND_013517 [Polypedilum vanderplanki]
MLLNRESYRTLLKILTFFGLWDEISVKQKRFTFKVPIIITILCGLIIALSLLQIDEFEKILEVFEITPMIIFVIISTFNFIYTKENLKNLLGIIDQIEEENCEISVVIDEACKLIKKLFTAFTILLTFVLINHTFCPFVFGKLNFPVYTPEILNDSQFMFYAPWLLHSIVAIYCGITNLALQGFRYSLLIIIDYVIQYFRQKLNNSNSDVDLIKCVKLHLHIKELIEKYAEIYLALFYAFLFSSTIMVVSLVFIIINSETRLKSHAFSIVYVIFLLFQIFMPCCCGSLIEQQSKEFVYDLFSSDWRDIDTKHKKKMIFIMENMKKTIQLRAFGFDAINLEFFFQVLKIVYSMYAVLQSMKD